MKGYKHLQPEQRQAVVESHRRTHNVRKTAEELGVSIHQVRYWVKQAGDSPGNARSLAYDRLDDIRRWANEDISLTEMARRLRVKRETVRKMLNLYEIPYGFVQTCENNPAWKGGRMIDPDGYVLIRMPDHPHANRHGYVREHRLVAEMVLDRLLERSEVVHHIDGNRQNNTPENLEVFSSNGEHLAVTRKGIAPQISAEGWQRIRESTRQMNMRRRLANQIALEIGDSPSPEQSDPSAA